MARRRKTESKSAVKRAETAVAVRKSSRQIAKKHQTGKTCNEESASTSKLNDSEESGSNQDYQSNYPADQADKTVPHKKFGKYRCLNNADDGIYSNASSAGGVIIEQCKRGDTEESDSQDGIDASSISSVKLSPEAVRQMVVGALVAPGEEHTNDGIVGKAASDDVRAVRSNSDEVTSKEVVWQEDVIEETIICEEMEVEEDAIDGSYTIDRDGSVVIEQVLLVNDPEYEGEGVVEFTVIEDKDGSESMVVSRESENEKSDEDEKEYQDIEEGVGNLTVKESKKNSSNGEPRTMESKSETSDEGVSGARNSDKIDREGFKAGVKKTYANLRKDRGKDRDPRKRSEQEAVENAEDSFDQLCKNVSRVSVGYPEAGDKSRLDDPGVGVQAEDGAPSRLDSDPREREPETKSRASSGRKITAIPRADTGKTLGAESAAPNCERADKSRTGVKRVVETGNKIEDKLDTPEQCDGGERGKAVEEDSSTTAEATGAAATADKVDSCDNGADPRDSVDALGTRDDAKCTNNDGNGDESSGDSETDLKADTEDIKVSSSSENSNDTLLSNRNYKLPGYCHVKSTADQPNETEKKTGFRSRSGSTDTTGSESGSNSSGVRRSSRIRSIGLMKQRCRGRGLVMKANFDLSRTIFQQDRDKLVNSSGSYTQESKDNSDNQSETQSDRESGINKTTSLDSPALGHQLLGTTGYDSDTSKPVKVKSRWRRSSELEMGGTVPAKKSSGSELEVIGDAVNPQIESPSSCQAQQSASKPTDSGNIPLPPDPEVDKEMEERLSQFECLKENLYRTERFTNKETKRMICDCFLTDEEIVRGELGCGEDCLNRLLMIECGSRCVVGERCTNKRFQQCDYAKCEVFRTEKKGFGLRAVTDLPAGEFLMEYVGEVVDPKDFRRRAKDYSKDKNRHYYFMALKSDQIIDATMKGNISRFINHSCDPNSETQKWTVNGELRVGFFNKQFIAAGEEITFDYHFQRYGKEAQKCFCEAENCRGWIGETPAEEEEKIAKKEKLEKDAKKKKEEEKKPHDYMEDEDLEEEIEKLCSGGLKNRAHTLTLSRLMVRSRDLEHRTRLLRLIQSGEQPCRRLFLDYHGLRLIWSYMMDIVANNTDEARRFRLEILKTLKKLPIPNKTMLMDSKVFAVVAKWAEQLDTSPDSGSPEDEQTKLKMTNGEPDNSCDLETHLGDNAENREEIVVKLEKEEESSSPIADVKQEAEDEARNIGDQMILTEMANGLLCSWANLKEVFRIPKKERIEQMKEHEREADRGYKEDLEKEDHRDKSYDRFHRSDRYGRGEGDKRTDRRRGRESPDFEYTKPKDKRVEERVNLVPIPRMSKFERRQLFAMQVAKEEEERQRRQQQDTWQEHEARCLALGIDPHTSAAIDPQTGYPLFFNPTLGQWQPYPAISDSGDLTTQCPVYLTRTATVPGHTQPGIIPSNSHMISPAVFTQPQPANFTQLNATYPAILAPHHESFPDIQMQIPGNLVATDEVGAKLIGEHPDALSAQTVEGNSNAEEPSPSVLSPEHLDLPPKWKYAKDAQGRIYYYNVIERISQWLPPPPEHVPGQGETSSSSESSEESETSDEEEAEIEEEDADEEQKQEVANCSAEVENPPDSSFAASNVGQPELSNPVREDNSIHATEPKKRRDGLVQERIISPRREDERVDHRKYKEIKDKLRRQKEKAKLKEHVEKLKKHRKSGKSKSHSRTSLPNKAHAITADLSSSVERKIKDTFRINMANVMVHFLNPYRKNDCKQGRITNTEDFKHLARKLTHFVLAKELKHCKSVDELQCNDNVKHKARDFVRKYMSKFGAVYQKASDED